MSASAERTDGKTAMDGFWPASSDWQHGSDNSEPASYVAIKVWIFHCADCGTNLPEGSHWPKYCTKGHPNFKNQTPAFLTYHCGRCGINLGETDNWPVKCAKRHLNSRA